MKVILPLYDRFVAPFIKRYLLILPLSLGIVAVAAAYLICGTGNEFKPATATLGIQIPYAHKPVLAGSLTHALLNQPSKTKGIQRSDLSTNTDSLKGSTWYNTVITDLKRKSYYVAAATGGAKSRNMEQGLDASYRAGSFTLSAIEAKNELPTPGTLPFGKVPKKRDLWQLQLTVDGLYADSKPVIDPATTPAMVNCDTSGVSFTTPGMVTQYINTAAGVRQNFIVQKAPTANISELRVKLHTSKNWVVAKAHDHELHFAQRNRRGGLDTRIIYKDLTVWDADGNKLLAKMEVGKNNQFDIVVAAKGAKYPVTIDPLSTTAATTLNGVAEGDNFGIRLNSAGDVNGDGYSDVVVAANGVAFLTGAAYIFMGSSTGLSSTAAVTLNGLASGNNFGVSVACAGDVNGDGFSDVVVGSANAGSYVYYGSSAGLAATASVTLNGDGRVASAGDVNGDGYSDVIVGSSSNNAAYLYYGPFTVSNPTPAVTLTGGPGRFGTSVASAGDVNGDGYSDVIVGADGVATDQGAAYVYYGSSTGLTTTPAVTLNGASANNFFGGNVASAGDVNGDGYGDVIIGAYNITINSGGSQGFTSYGAAYVYYGSTTGLNGTAAVVLRSNTQQSAFYGFSVASAGDVNHDGYADVAVGAFGTSTYKGAVYVYYGSSTGLNATAAITLNGLAANDQFGFDVASAGDVNGDGYSDMLVGANGVSNQTGAAYLYQGSPNVLSTIAQSTQTGGGDGFAYSVASAGDVNGDGYSDVVIGSPVANEIYIYYGSASGLSFTPLVIPSPAGGRFGFSVASAGDVNGDGYSDVVVGAYLVGGSGQGAAYVYHGSSGGLSTTPAVTLNGNTSYDYLGWSVASAGDVNGDGYSDVIVGGYAYNGAIGRCRIYHGSASGLASSPTVILDGVSAGGFTFFGYTVATAGDVNGDGYSDVIVGAPRIFGNKGAAYLYYGSQTGISTTPAVTLNGAAPENYFGTSVASAGDVNGDGFSDVVVSAPNIATSVYHGSATGLSTTATVSLLPPGGNDFGNSVASAGDINGDGYSDLIVGAPSVAKAYAYYGSPTGLSSTASVTLNGFSYFGNSVASSGDVDGDGNSDLVVGASAIFSSAPVYFIKGNAGSRGNTHRLRIYNSNLTTLLTQSNMAEPQFGAGLFVRPFAGATKARLVWETKMEGIGFMHNSPITNFTGYTSAAATYTNIPPVGIELKGLIAKTGRATKFRVRVQYKSSVLPNGQVFGPWIYPQTYHTGAKPGVLKSPSVTLPLKLISFTAQKLNDQRNQLVWTTATEDPGLMFSVTRSPNGRVFETLGIVQGQGNAANYTFYDDQPLPGTNYYRLKMVEANSATSYSKVAIIYRGAKDGGLTAWPIPATSTITITNTNASLIGQSATIIDMQGRVLLTFKLSSSNVIDVLGWPAGIYNLKVPNGQTVRLMKQ